MAKYTLRITESEIYVVTVEAKTESEAFELAINKISTESGKQQHHDDSDGDYEVIEEE